MIHDVVGMKSEHHDPCRHFAEIIHGMMSDTEFNDLSDFVIQVIDQP